MRVYEPDVEAILGSSRDLAMGGAFDGASRFDRSLALWAPAIQSVDADILPDKSVADARVRDMSRNDAYVQGGANLHKDSIVGAMFLLNAKPAYRTLGADEAWAEEFQTEVEEKFTLWAESPNNWVDASRTNTFTSMIRLLVGIYTMAGEVLATAEWINSGPVRPYKTAIQMVDVDRLSNPWNDAWGLILNDKIRGGVEFGSFGEPIAYHIRSGHPTDPFLGNVNDWRRVPIRKPWGRLQVIHILEQMRPDQSRGISEMVAALKEMKITKRFRDVVLQNAVVNASYAATIESELPPEAAYQQLGGGNVGEGIVDYAQSYLSAIAAYAGSSRNVHIDGVKIPHLFPGTTLNLRPAGTAGGVGTGFEQSLLRYIAANLGVSYEELSKDYSQTNYSSIRAAGSTTQRFMLARKRMVADRGASSIYRLWLEEAINAGEITTYRPQASWYDGLNADAYSRCDWIGAGRGQIDELKETQAAVLRLKYHLSTYEEEAARLGKDWRTMFVQREREVKELKARGLEVQEANAINAASGAAREAGSTGDKPEKSTGEKATTAVSVDFTGMADVIKETVNAGQDRSGDLMSALIDIATRVPEATPITVDLKPSFAIDVDARPGKTRTKVTGYDERGRILGSESEPVDEDEEKEE